MKKYVSCFLSALLIIGFSFLPGKVSAQTSQADTPNNIQTTKETPPVKGITSGRARALATGVLGLSSLIIGWWARARSAKGVSNVRSWSVTALMLGLICIVLSITQLATTRGGFGTGGGKAGAIVALVPALIGVTLSSLALRTKIK